MINQRSWNRTRRNDSIGNKYGRGGYKEKDVSINALMALVNAKSQELPQQKKGMYDHPPPLPSLQRPQPPIYPLTLIASKENQDPIKTYRKKDYPYLQLFENGIAVFPNFSKSVALPRSPPPEQSKKENIRKILAWKYSIPFKDDRMGMRDTEMDGYVTKPKTHRFSRYPSRQQFYIRTGLAFPQDKPGKRKHSFDKPETLQPFYTNLHDPNQKTRRFVTDMSEFEDAELTFVIEGNSIEIFGTKQQSKSGNFRQTVEKINLPKDLHIEKVHFVRDYQRVIIIEEKWEISID